MKRFLFSMAALVAALMAVGPATAGSYSLVTTRPTSTDIIDWSQLGTTYTTLSSPQSFTSTGGNSGSVTDSGTLERRDQNNGWGGNFTPGDSLLWNQDNGNPITLSFNTPVSQAGAQIQADYYGNFTATITAYDSMGNQLAQFSENGVSSGSSDGSAIYIGVAGPNISQISFTSVDTYGGQNRNAINQVTLNGSVATPEPASMTLLGLGSLGLAGYGWRRRMATATV